MGVEEAAARTAAEVGQRRIQRDSRTRYLTTAGLLTALISAAAWISLPIGAVPVTLQVFVVLLSGLLLPPVWAASAMAAYLLLGAGGAPVFHGGLGGLGTLLGPTGGYLVGFMLAAPVVALTRRPLGRASGSPLIGNMIAALLGIAAVYLCGWLWLMQATGMTPFEAAMAGVGPFILPDAGKGVAAVAVAAALRRGGVVDRDS